jgi:hypothetical protein
MTILFNNLEMTNAMIYNNSNSVASTSPIYDVMAENWKLPLTLMGGEKAMKEAGQTYLPREPMETEPQYLNRLARSTLKNYFAWAVENHTGRVFKKPIVFSDDTDKTIFKYNDNLDLMSNDADTFYKEVFRDMLIKGISYVYVDYPRSQEDLTLADELEGGYRPYCVHIKAEQVINAVSGMVNSRKVLVRAHILETVVVPNGQWGYKNISQIRVLYPGRWELYRLGVANSSESWQLFDSGETSLDYIPLIPLYGRKFGFFGGVSPLQNLANLNRAHWQSLSDQMNITHVARVPILFGTGFDDGDTLTIGSKSAIMGPETSALTYVEHTGKAIEAGMNELRDLEDRMMLESLELLDQKGGDTATSRSLGVSDINCSLQDLAIKLQKMIIRVNDVLCDWDGVEKTGTVVVNVDFGLQLRDGSEGNILLKMRQNKSISINTFHREMKRRGILSPDFNSEEDLALLEEEATAEAEKAAMLPNAQPYIDETGKQIVGDRIAPNVDTGKPRIE